MSWADGPHRVVAAYSSLRPELAQDGGIVANVTSSVENDAWVLIGDVVILVRLNARHTYHRPCCFVVSLDREQDDVVVGRCRRQTAHRQALTIIGSLAILISMAVLEYRGRPSTTRTRLVQALILSDFLLGYVCIQRVDIDGADSCRIVGLIGVSLALQPRGLRPGQACDGLSVVLVAILWSGESLWLLSLRSGRNATMKSRRR
jgi:hypothetical protein